MNTQMIFYLVMIMLMSFFAGTYVDVIRKERKGWLMALFFMLFAIVWALKLYQKFN